MSKFCFAAFVAVMVGVSAYAKEQANKDAQAGFPKRVNANAEALKMFDKDGDGKLNDEERTAMREQMRKNREKKFDTNGDGKLDEKERAAMQEARKAQVKEFDKDGDGKLSDEERKAMREALIKRHQGKGKGKDK
ncbi:MAG: hypothetical protein PHV28_09885 [Kiritimatiellae bacterium]|nr:hypothetical protein [Kiritimatiellia bacterium]